MSAETGGERPVRVRLHRPPPGADYAGTVEVDDVPVPQVGAIVTVAIGSGTTRDDLRVATIFVTGSSALTGTRVLTLTATVEVPTPLLARLATAPGLRATVVVHAAGSEPASFGPLPLETAQRPAD